MEGSHIFAVIPEQIPNSPFKDGDRLLAIAEISEVPDLRWGASPTRPRFPAGC
jgi:hypothetical protein